MMSSDVPMIEMMSVSRRCNVPIMLWKQAFLNWIRQNTLETDQAASRNHISGLQARLDALEARLQTVEKMARDRGQNLH